LLTKYRDVLNEWERECNGLSDAPTLFPLDDSINREVRSRDFTTGASGKVLIAIAEQRKFLREDLPPAIQDINTYSEFTRNKTGQGDHQVISLSYVSIDQRVIRNPVYNQFLLLH
jgi:hypothetical protein